MITGELKSKIDRVWDASQQLVLLDEVASDGWWVDVTLPMLELARLRIRGLVRFVEPTLRNPVYNKQLTAHDLAPLEQMLLVSGAGREADIDAAAQQSEGLGLFVRSLVGLDR